MLVSNSFIQHNWYFRMNADKTEAELVSRLACNGSVGTMNRASSCGLLKPVTIIIAKLLKPGG